MRKKHLTVVLLVAACGAALAGAWAGRWSRNEGNSPPAPAELTPAQSAGTEFDLGVVCEGESVRHEFVYVNRTGETLRIGSDSDIRVGCGCSSLTPSAREVPPGGDAKLLLSARTEGMRNAFTLSASVVWSGDGGNKYPFSMRLTGEALPLLSTDSDLLSFEPPDVEAGTVKYVVISGNRFTNLHSWAVTAQGDSISVGDPEPFGDNRVRVGVRCRAPDGLWAVTGTLQISAQIRKSQRPISQESASLAIPVQVRQRIDLSVQPARLLLAVEPETGDARGSLLLRGEALAGAQGIKSVRCGTCEVEWKASPPSGAHQSVLSVRLPNFAKLEVKPPALVIEVDGRGVIEVPIVHSSGNG